MVDEDGNKTKTPKETAESLLNFFQSVFKGESFGPLPEKCFENKNITGKVMEGLEISPEQVKKLLLKLNENKSMGPDGLQPKLLLFIH